MNESLFANTRKQFHQSLIEGNLWIVDSNGIPSNADIGDVKKAKRGDYNTSTLIAMALAEKVGVPKISVNKKSGTSAGTLFEKLVMQYIESTFPELQHLRPGKWGVMHVGNKGIEVTSKFAQYAHLQDLDKYIKENGTLAATLGNGYMIKPDIVVYRESYSDAEINANAFLVDDTTTTMADLREKYNGMPIMHASISAKWTMRSDRAQNSRTEALNLIRNRKGNLPHIVVVTNEPLPSRLASLALGTGDIDCMYHCALYELVDAVKEYSDSTNRDDVFEQLQSLVDGKRLKDISDLPLDLAV